MTRHVVEDPTAGPPQSEQEPKDQIPRRRQRPVASSDEDGRCSQDQLSGDENGEKDGWWKRVVTEKNVRVAIADFSEAGQTKAPENMMAMIKRMRRHFRVSGILCGFDSN